MSYFDERELQEFGFRQLGRGVRLSRRASIYGASRISLGDNSRIDDFCVLSVGSGGIQIGRHVHIAVMCSLIGKESITIDDFANLSSRVAVYSSTDDFSGEFMTNPTVPEAFTGVESRPVTIGRHCIIGASSVLLPGSTVETGSALGALSVAKGRIPEFSIHAGVPARWIKLRRRDLLELEQKLAASP